MDNYIIITHFVLEKGRATIDFEVSNNLKTYFKSTTFWYKMEGLKNVPKSIVVIPFVCNILPIAWLANSTIFLQELDVDFYKSIEEIKKGYINMYPMLSFNGLVFARKHMSSNVTYAQS